MLNKAIEKIKKEMDQNKNNSYIEVVGCYLLQHLGNNPGDAEKILTEGKTIGKSLDEMRKAAEKRQVNRCGMLSPQEGFEFVMKYFGIVGEPVIMDTPQPLAYKVEPDKVYEKKNTGFSVSLDDLL